MLIFQDLRSSFKNASNNSPLSSTLSEELLNFITYLSCNTLMQTLPLAAPRQFLRVHVSVIDIISAIHNVWAFLYMLYLPLVLLTLFLAAFPRPLFILSSTVFKLRKFSLKIQLTPKACCLHCSWNFVAFMSNYLSNICLFMNYFGCSDARCVTVFFQFVQEST